MEGSAVSSSDGLIETLISRGWRFGDLEQVKALVVIQSALLDEGFTVDLLESELANMDLRAVGAKSLPDNAAFRKLSYIQGPKVLQIASVRDVSRSTVAEESGSSNSRRLLRLNLTDGHTEITAIEYSHIPSIPDNVVPGTKVRLENKALVHSGIVCLNPKVVTVLGGVVQTLYEEYQMNKKYAGITRSSLKPSGDNEVSGPPPFKKLQIEAPAHQLSQQGRVSYQLESNGNSAARTNVRTSGKSGIRQPERGQNIHGSKSDDLHDDMKSAQTERTEKMPSSSETRPREDRSESNRNSAGPTNVRTSGKPESRQAQRRQKNLGLKSDDLHDKMKRSQTERTEMPSCSETRPTEDQSEYNYNGAAGPANLRTSGNPQFRQAERWQKNLDLKPDDLPDDLKRIQIERIEEMPSSSETRPKEVAESVPVQNQVASQKLLQKMSHPNQDAQHFKGRRQRGKGKQEDLPVYTLLEWEESYAGTRLLMTKTDEHPDASRDEELARQLQNQFDLEDLSGRVQEVPRETEAERLRRTMFSFERDGNSNHEMGHRGRGRGMGRGRGRGGGRGRGRGREKFN